VVQVDLGNYFKPLGPGSKEINELMTESLGDLQVLNLAPEDLFLWNELAARQASLASHIISTNLTPRDANTPTPKRYAVVEIAGNRIGLPRNLRIGFLGLSDPRQVKPNSGFTASEPAEAVAAVKAEVMQKADFLVVLADLPRPSAIRLPLAHPEILAVLVTEKVFQLPPPEQANNAVIMSSVERGRWLAQLDLELDEQGRVAVVRPNWIELKKGVSEDPSWLRRERELAGSLPSSVTY
jgi:2',3'-cyclic-nucleotide 2'-phosphodiesterase (5'-nucleotidase family)